MTSPRDVLTTLIGWPVGTQHGARRNALVASTAMAQRRQERLEVEQFLLLHARRHPVPQAAGALSAGVSAGVAAGVAAGELDPWAESHREVI
jgi:hypothetical protein